MPIWNNNYDDIEHILMSGSKKMNGTLDNTAVSDNGDGTVDIAITAHGQVVGNQVILAGTTNYDGVHAVKAISANAITIAATYVAETPAGTETYFTCFQTNPTWQDYQIMEIRLTLSAAGGAAEAYTIDLDHESGAAWDVELDTVADMTLISSAIWAAWEERRYFNGGDILTFTYANTNGRTWGLEIIIRKQS